MGQTDPFEEMLTADEIADEEIDEEQLQARHDAFHKVSDDEWHYIDNCKWCREEMAAWDASPCGQGQHQIENFNDGCIVCGYQEIRDDRKD